MALSKKGISDLKEGGAYLTFAKVFTGYAFDKYHYQKHSPWYRIRFQSKELSSVPLNLEFVMKIIKINLVHGC